MSASKGQSHSSLLFGILRVGHILDERLDNVLAPHRLSVAKLVVLENLVNASVPIPLGVLSERIGCVKSNVTQLVDRLEGDKLVQRVADPQDRRSVLAAITEEGRQRYHAGRRALEDAEREIIGNLSANEREHLASLLAHFEEKESRS